MSSWFAEQILSCTALIFLITESEYRLLPDSYMDFPSLFFSRFVMISGSSLQHVPLSSYFPCRSFRDVSESRMHPGSQGTTACICSKLLVLWGEGGIFFFGCSWPAGSIFLVVSIWPRAFLLFCDFENIWTLCFLICSVQCPGRNQQPDISWPECVIMGEINQMILPARGEYCLRGLSKCQLEMEEANKELPVSCWNRLRSYIVV